MAEVAPVRLLFVDDEASIRMTLPPVLKRAGFEVHVAESVADALLEINSKKFQVLISDLNIGEEGDGFLVTSAMRHVQPDCLTFILTGYPAFETALQAIHNHIDDYLVKPVEIDTLIKVLQSKLENRGTKPIFGEKRLADILKQNSDQIVKRVLAAIGKEGQSSWASSVKADLTEAISFLESGSEEVSASSNGKRKISSPSSAAADKRGALEQEVFRAVQNNMTGMDLALLIADLKKFDACVHSRMQQELETTAGGRPKRS